MQTFKFFWTTYQMTATTGKVLQADRDLETHVHGNGGYHNQATGYISPVRISSSTTTHDRLFLMGKDGREQHYHLRDFHLSCRADNMVTVIAAIDVKKGEGPYIAVVNHTTEKVYFKNSAIKSICVPEGRRLLAGFFIFAILVFAAFGPLAWKFLAFILIGGTVAYFVFLNDNMQKVKNSITPKNYPLQWENQS